MNQRRDARRNRARIIAAAAEVFREEGAGAPLDLVARRADVGRGTLYRHFADRHALIGAVLATRMDGLEQYAADYAGDDLLEHLLVDICTLWLDTPGLITAVRDPEASLAPMVERTTALLSAALDRGRRTGVVRPDVTLADVLTVIAMFDGVASAGSDVLEGSPVDRALRIALRGLRTAARSELPVPPAALALPSAAEVMPD